MRLLVILYACMAMVLTITACDNDNSVDAKNSQEVQKTSISRNVEHKLSTAFSKDILRVVAADQGNFLQEFNKLDSAQQYYFCAAFTMGAMSVAKPITASAMVNYFMGLGVVQYNRGIDEQTYMAFDFGKNIFHFEKAINTILQEKICENIIGSASKSAKAKNMSTKEINDIGNVEVKKIVSRIKK